MKILIYREMFLFVITLIFMSGIFKAEALTQLTSESVAELKECDIKRCTNYALTGNGGKAGLLFPDDPKYGTQKSLVTIIDNNLDTDMFLFEKGKNRSAKSQIIIELSSPQKISAFSWFGEMKGVSGYGRSPSSYTVKVSLDGKAWTMVAQQKKSCNKQIHLFEPVMAKYVAMADILPPPELEMRVREVGVYDLNSKKTDYSIEEPSWWNRDYKFRVQIENGKDLLDGGRIIRRINLTNLVQGGLGDVKGAPPTQVDISTLRIVQCAKQENGFEQKDYLPDFIPDARFNNDYAAGKIIWTVPSVRAPDVSWWLYFNTVTTDKNNAIIKPVEYSLDLPAWNYCRGFSINGTITLQKITAPGLNATLKINLMDGVKNIFTKEYSVKFISEKKQEIAFNVPTSSFACKDYDLEFTMFSDKGDKLFSTAASITIVPPAKHHLEFGVYGFLGGNEQGYINCANILAKHNINASTAGDVRNVAEYKMLDAATGAGINIYPYEPSGLYPSGPQKVVSENGTGDVYRQFNAYCPNDPSKLTKMSDSLKSLISTPRRYGSFRGFNCFDDYAFEPVKDQGETRWSCYCQYCRKRYQDTYAAPIPYLGKNTSGKDDLPGQKRIIKWDNSIIADSDPALRFIVERCKSVGDYVGSYEKAIHEVDSSLEIGMMRQYSTNVAWGEWPPYCFKNAKVLSMYDYVSSGCLPLEFITNYEVMQMGNRGKKSWILMEAMDIEKFTRNEREPVPVWLIRSQFWHGLAAGYKNISFFGLTQFLYKNTIFAQEAASLGALSQKVGPLFGSVKPSRADVAILASFPDFAQPDNLNAWRPAFSKISEMHKSLLTNGVSCEIVADDEIIDGYLNNYKVVIVPAIKYIRQSAYDALKKYKGAIFVDESCTIKIPSALTYSPERIVTESAIYGQSLSVNTGNENVVCREFGFPEGALFVLVNSQAEVSGQLRKYRWGKLKMIDARPVNCQFKLKENWVCYDLLLGKQLKADNDQAIPLTLDAGGGKILVCYKNPIEQVLLKSTVPDIKRGTAGIITAIIQSAGKCSTTAHLLKLTVICPDGQLSNEYSRTLLAENGTAEISIPFAINDSLGSWRIEVTEVASNISSNCSVKLIE